ncbi:hypothetical protein [Anabaena lutea]|uniref:Uncharacterized protein n=1 Tax=Anabaena lutea FACHB-196 TaxID=2692881 RepID=A0ABR8FHX6_9NOST|nr:hypothetical protein [Anabaena lutea]MBD2569704.1 hypothetical protein [Anabaena lutea FACHB-196]
MTLTVQELTAKLEQFQDSATVQVEDTDGIYYHAIEVKEENGHAILVIKSEDESDEGDE